MSNPSEIKGSGDGYYDGMDADSYLKIINSPAGSRAYHERFNLPVLQHAFGNRDDRRVTLVDIACGPAYELDLVAEDPRVDIVASDISRRILLEVQKRLGGRVVTITADAAEIPSMPEFPEHSADAGIIVNGMIYVPDKMLGAMAWVLKPGALCAANFRIYGNPYNEAFYNYYTERGCVLARQELPVSTEYGSDTFDVAVLDCTQCLDSEGRPDAALSVLGQQVFFTSINDVVNLIELSGFTPRRNSTFDFESPANPHNQVNVFTMQA